MKVGILGDEDSGRKLATHLNNQGTHADFISTSLRKNFTSLLHLRNYDIVHGVYMRRFVVLSLFIAKLMGKFTVCHWEGTDVMRATKEKAYRLMASFLNSFVDLNLTFSVNLQQELSQLGITATVFPIPVEQEYFQHDLPPLPERFTVLCKIADDWLYGSSYFLKLVEALPNVQFLVVPGANKTPSELLSQLEGIGNVSFLGWKTNMLDVYKQVNVLLRLTKHDGMSYMVVEALALGRQVVWTHDFLPFCHFVRDFEEAKQAIQSIQADPELNVEGAEYVLKNFSAEVTVKELVGMYEGMMKA